MTTQSEEGHQAVNGLFPVRTGWLVFSKLSKSFAQPLDKKQFKGF